MSIGSIPHGADFGGLVHTEKTLAFNQPSQGGRWDWTPRISRFLRQILSFQKKKKDACGTII
jgi:hypothetical protein